MWVILSCISALLLGIYDVFKKKSLKDNSVIPVLTSSICISFIIFLPFVAFSKLCPDKMGLFFIPEIAWETHMFIALKAFIVLCSWICGFFAMKHIPITIFSPIRATQPIWTVVGALLIFNERLSLWQIVGCCVALVCFYFFSIIGSKEDIVWKKNKWILLIILATVFGAISGLYDKHLMLNFDRKAVQVYSTFYQAIIMLLVLFFLWFPTRQKTTPFAWRWSIVGISIFLILADFVYFFALSKTNSLIAVVSTIRRSGAVVPFFYGAIFLHEKNIRIKTILLCGVLVGVLCLYLGR